MPKEVVGFKHKKGEQYVLIETGSSPTIERQGFVDGLFNELNQQLDRYLDTVRKMAELQASIMIVERNLRLTRDHLWMVLGDTEDEVPSDWQKTLYKIRFVGARPGDACLEILKAYKSLTTQQMLEELNSGQFRFRTGSPLREINAALLRQPLVRKEDDLWIYEEPKKATKRAISKKVDQKVA